MHERKYFELIWYGPMICGLSMAAAASGGLTVPSQSVASKQPGPSAQVDPATAFAQGQAALRAGDLNAAEKSFRQVLTVDPRSAAVYANLGVIAMRRKNWDHALELLQKAERLDSKMAGIRLNIGIVEFRRANYPAAIPALSSVLKDQPNSAQARYLLGLCQVFTERYADAVSTLEPLWTERLNDVMYLYVLGIAAHNAGNDALDQKALLRMIDVGGDSAELHFILGKSYLNRQEADAAVIELNKAAASNPDLPYLHFTLGMANARLGHDDLAEQEFRKDTAIEPDLADDYAQLGFLYTRSQQPEEGEEAFAEAVRRDPRMASARLGLAQLYFNEGKFAPALREADAALALAPESQNVHYLRGRILARLGRQDEAKVELAIAQKLMNQSLGKARADLDEKAIPTPELTHDPN
jgi:tetratricopeptide (TPR) repeat protein